MGVFDGETYLPGVITEIQADYSYGYDTSLFGSTDSQVIIGTAFDGPVGVLVDVYSPEHAEYVFGKCYDEKTKKEASLVAGVKDAWDRGGRTISVVRIGGKDVYKDFEFCIDSGLRLRVASSNPTNTAKQIYLRYDNMSGNETLKIYKPALRATIAEKMQGLVTTENDMLINELRLNQDFGMNRDSKLVDLIRLVNEYTYNNVLKLSIVDKDGIDVTNSSEAYEMAVGALFPGVYFIGRDKTKCTEFTEIKFALCDSDAAPKPFASFNGAYYRKLAINTDVAQPYPIYAESISDLRNALQGVNISMSKPYDFLEINGVSDRAFSPDSKDYEEADLTKFEIYRRLGSGFATTAVAERRVDGANNEITPRIKETPMDDPNRIIAIKDGIYSMLENAPIRYRVLTCAAADDVIAGKLPRPADYLKAFPEEVLVLDDMVRITPKIAASERVSPKEYSFKFENLNGEAISNLTDVYTDAVLGVVPSIANMAELDTVSAKPGSYVMLLDAAGQGTLIKVGENSCEIMAGAGLVGKLYLVDGYIYEGVMSGAQIVFNKVTVVAATAGLGTYQNKGYVLGENLNHIFVYQVVDDPAAHVKPLGDLKTMLSSDTEKTLVYAQSNHFQPNQVTVRSAVFDAMTLEEFVECMNSNMILGQLFIFELTDAGSEKKDDYVSEVCAGDIDNTEYNMLADRRIGYDYSLYIPYKTTDNFARQLAQHCTYTELKTAATFGQIGCARLLDTSLDSVANKVEAILAAEFDLNAKNDIGRNMLDKNNMPYPIGKNLTIVFTQYNVNMDDGYRYISNGAAGYSGMISTLPLDQSSTSQPIAIGELHFGLTNYQLTRLTSKGLLTVKRSYTKGLVVTDGITMAPVSSVFRRLNVSRIIGAVEELIRQAAEPYIGKQNHTANRNSLHTAIKSNLDKIMNVLVEDYKFNMIIDPKGAKFSYITIDYEVVPIYEIREVRNRIAVKDKLSA